MEDAVKIARAQLRALNSKGDEVDKDKTVHVQFNPETLKVSFKTNSTGQRQLCTVSDGGETCFSPAD